MSLLLSVVLAAENAGSLFLRVEPFQQCFGVWQTGVDRLKRRLTVWASAWQEEAALKLFHVYLADYQFLEAEPASLAPSADCYTFNRKCYYLTLVPYLYESSLELLHIKLLSLKLFKLGEMDFGMVKMWVGVRDSSSRIQQGQKIILYLPTLKL